MLAMQMSIRLGADRDRATVHGHVSSCAERLAHGPGLIHASCLYDEETYRYEPFYIWKDNGALRSFLFGDSFTEVVESCGRPRVRTWSVLEFDRTASAGSPTFAVREIDAIATGESLCRVARREREHHRHILQSPGLIAHGIMFDPDRWEVVRLGLWRDAGCVEPGDADCIDTYHVTEFLRPASGSA